MKLAKYLADYIEHEEEQRVGGINPEDMEEVIQQGIEAFCSTENVTVRVNAGTFLIHKRRETFKP